MFLGNYYSSWVADKAKVAEIAIEHRLEIDTFGLTALPGFYFKSENNLTYKTLITQEMLKKGYLAANSVYVCTEHTEQVLNDYFEALSPAFQP